VCVCASARTRVWVRVRFSVYVCLFAHRSKKLPQHTSRSGVHFGLYTILRLPILYGVWHTQGGRMGGRILPNHRATVLQQYGQCRRAGRMKRRLIRAQTTRSKTISCTGQGTLSVHSGDPEIPFLDRFALLYPLNRNLQIYNRLLSFLYNEEASRKALAEFRRLIGSLLTDSL